MGKLANIHGLARQLDLPARWLAAEATAGRIPSLKIGRKRLFNVAAVETALATRAAQEAASEVDNAVRA